MTSPETGPIEPPPREPILARDPADLPADLPRGAEIPEGLDPLADGVLMLHQAEWLEDQADLKVCQKGRRTGITFAESLDDTLIVASARSAGGQNVFYIGDTKEKGREFIGYIAHFAKVVAKELAAIEEFLFEDQREDGSSKNIAAYRVRFASGFRVEALSSRPENIRGLQGIVVIDEAAYHKDVRALLDAVNALLIWGGKIRIISTHNGVLNPFNELIREAEAGKIPFSVHTIPFAAAVKNGLFKRVCMMTGKTWSQEAQEAWEARIRGSYGSRKAAERQELDAIPADAVGAALSRVQIEAAMTSSAPVLRFPFDDDFKHKPSEERKAEVERLFRQQIKPVLETLSPSERHVTGMDFARSGDASVLYVLAVDQLLNRVTRLVLELRNCPFEQQRDFVFLIIPMLKRYSGSKFDATGNGAYLAEVTAQKFGAEMVEEIQLTAGWYGIHAPRYVDAIAERTMQLPKDEDTAQDHQGLQYVASGIIKIPDDHRTKGTDGLDRHGDSAIGGMIAYAASEDMRMEVRIDTPSTVAAEESGGLRGAFDSLRRRLWG